MSTSLRPYLTRSLLLLVTLLIGLLALVVAERATGSNGPTVLPSIVDVAKPGAPGNPPPGGGGGGGGGNPGGCKPKCQPSQG